jgi:thiol:disulfide interchange protein DsbD
MLPSVALAAPDVGFSLSFAAFLGALFLAGVGTSLTPCVYPMVSVTVGIFGAKKATSRWQAFSLSLVYVLGIQVTFITLGVISALAGQALGSALANPYVNLGLAVLFVVMALSYFGVYDLALPESLQNQLGSVGGSGYPGAFAMGLVGGIIAAPCTGPALGALATTVGTTQDLTLGVLGFSAFGFGLGLLFLIVGTFSSLALPKSGDWLDAVKSVLGIVILVVALYYAQFAIRALTIRSDALWIAGVGVAIALVGLLMGAVHLSIYSGAKWVKLRKGVAVLLATAGAYVVVGWINFVPENMPFHKGGVDDALVLAKEGQRPVFIDFGAEWCNACKQLEAHVFNDPDVIREAGRFLPVRVDCTDRETGDCAEMEKRYTIPGFPSIFFFSSEGEFLPHATLVGEVSASDFLAHLRTIE